MEEPKPENKPTEKKHMRMSIFRPVAETNNEFTELMDKYKTTDIKNIDRLKSEFMMDLKKLSNKQTEHQGKRTSRFNLYHYFFKPKFLLPLVYLGRKLLGKSMPISRREIPDEPYNRNAQILWDVWSKTYYEWTKNFKNCSPNNEQATEEMIRQQYEHDIKNEVVHCYHVPDFMIRYAIQVYLEDTAYREMINQFMFNLQGEMNKKWNPEIQHKFPMYTVMYDMFIPYFCEWMKQNGGGTFMINVEPGNIPNPHIDQKHLEQVAKEANFPAIKAEIDRMEKEGQKNTVALEAATEPETNEVAK
jgi:hypothetical protein